MASHNKVPTRRLLWSGPGWSQAKMKRFMEHGRDWNAVAGYWRRVVRGETTLEDLGLVTSEECLLGPDWTASLAQLRQAVPGGLSLTTGPKTGKLRLTYKVALSYDGTVFDGWSRQKHLSSLEGLLVATLKDLYPGSNFVVSPAGRTDKGVSASGQVISFYAWHAMPPGDLLAALNAASPGSVRAWWVEQVPRSFHATFSAQWRRYVYLFPLRHCTTETAELGGTSVQRASTGTKSEPMGHKDVRKEDGSRGLGQQRVGSFQTQVDDPGCSDNCEAMDCGTTASTAFRMQEVPEVVATSGGLAAPQGCDQLSEDGSLMDLEFNNGPIDNEDVVVGRVDELLRTLEGQTLDFYAFARDTPKGKNCTSHIMYSRATTAYLPSAASTQTSPVQVMCIELVANRFLRRMVRVVVSTAIRESIQAAARRGGDSAALIQLAETKDRMETALGAPPEGLCLAGAGYEGAGSYWTR